MPERVLAIDAGERRIGLAVSDELGLLATPVEVVQRTGGLRAALDRIGQVARREGVAHVIVGLPLNDDGSAGPQARRAEAFASVARKALGLPVELWNEAHSSAEAEAILRQHGPRRGRQARRRASADPGLDAVAAAVILQDYLDTQHRAR